MPNQEQDFRDGLEQAFLKPDAEGPTDAQGAADEPEMVCPTCGASAAKIAQAGQPPSGPPAGMEPV